MGLTSSPPASGLRVLAFAPGPWRIGDVAGSTRYHLWELARRGACVVYVEPPLGWSMQRWSWMAEDRNFTAFRARRVAPFAPRLAPPGWLGEKLRAQTSAQLAREGILRLTERTDRPDVVWYGAPWHGSLLRHVKRALEPLGPTLPGHTPVLHVCHIYDDLAKSPSLSESKRARLAEWEAELTGECDLTLCSSLPQVDARRSRSQHAMLLQNAVPDEFLAACESDAPCPPEHAELVQRLLAIPSPRLVYGGVVDLRLDGAFFRAALEAVPGASLVFLGNREEIRDPVMRALLEDKRVHVFGRVPHVAYPHLYKHADALLLAHAEMPFTRGMYPEKLNEYLASGRPIAARDLTEVRRVTGEANQPRIVRIAATPETFAEAVREAVADKDAGLMAARRALARQHTWSVEGERLEAMLREGLQRKSQLKP